MNVTNKHCLDERWLKLYEYYTHDKGDSHYSITQLLNPPQLEALKIIHKEHLTIDISDQIASILGSMMHEKLYDISDKNSDSIEEERLYLTINGIRFSGQPDRVFKTKRGWTIGDWKQTSAYAVMKPKKEWEEQLNCYAYLLKHGSNADGFDYNIDVSSLEITAVIKDWKRRDAQTRHDYPQAQVVNIPVPLWSEKEQLRFITDRLNTHADYTVNLRGGGEVLFEHVACSDEERWANGGGFAVMKAGRKTAVRVFNNKDKATSYIAESNFKKDLYIEERERTYIRCENYCEVSQFCDQFNKREI